MTKTELLKGEKDNVEFKAELSPKDKNLLKTIVAFANCSGGTIIFGVDDKSHKVIGIDNDELFILMDAIANKISDSISPQIIPLITFQTVQNKTIVVVEIQKGQNTPYFIKSEGQVDGVYIRVGATSRKAESEKVKELTLWGSQKTYDEIFERVDPASEKDIETLCEVITRYNGEKKVTKENLINWKLLKEQRKKFYPSVAFRLLTENDIYFCDIIYTKSNFL